MSENSTIEWTESTWNPVRGCTKVSPGCKHCYAETFAERFRGVSGHPYEQGFDLRIVPHKLWEPLKWSEPRTIFVNSMSDLFQDGVPDDYILDVASVMAKANWHTYQVLTKRSERMREMLNGSLSDFAKLEHIWWGVSVEDRKYGLPRVEHLRKSKAKVRFLSVEPLLEDLGSLDLSGIHWVIVGGESGHGARPMDASWVRSIRQQCRVAGVPFFFKQWGGVQKKKNGRLLDGRFYDEMPPITHHPVMESKARKAAILELEEKYPPMVSPEPSPMLVQINLTKPQSLPKECQSLMSVCDRVDQELKSMLDTTHSLFSKKVSLEDTEFSLRIDKILESVQMIQDWT